MSAAIIDSTEFTAYGNRSLPMSEFQAGQLTEAIDRATDRIRQAALNDYTAESFELLTTANAPDDLRATALKLALAILTRGDAGRPQSIDEGNAEAKAELGYIAGGTTHFDKSPGSVLVKLAKGTSSVASYKPAERVFDRTNDSQKWNQRDPEL